MATTRNLQCVAVERLLWDHPEVPLECFHVRALCSSQALSSWIVMNRRMRMAMQLINCSEGPHPLLFVAGEVANVGVEQLMVRSPPPLPVTVRHWMPW